MNKKSNIGRLFLCFFTALSMIIGGYLILPSSEIESDDYIATILKDPHDPRPGHYGEKKDPADLKITDIWTSPSSPIGGQSATIYAKIQNIGDKDVKTAFYSHLYIDGSYSTSKYLAELAAGGYSYITKTVTLGAGYHELKAIADVYDYIEEPDEGNNQRIENIYWQSVALPDIVATDIWTSPSSPIGGQSTTIYFKISTNSVPFTATVQTALFIDTVQKTTKYLYGSSGSTSVTYSYTTTLAAGDHEIRMITDINHAVEESSETNNLRVETFNWADADSDGDGLTDSYEISIGSNPYDPTTDSDAWNDGEEVLIYFTDPTLSDTDGDSYRDDLDFDPLQDLYLKVKILRVYSIDQIGSDGLATFYWKVTVDSLPVQSSPQSYFPSQNKIIANFAYYFNIADNVQFHTVKIELWDNLGDTDRICDISRDAGGGDNSNPDGSNIELYYDLSRGDWNGDDYFGDLSGYGRASGNDDDSYSSDQEDCDLWFELSQQDLVGDTDWDELTYWEEIHLYSTSPIVNDGLLDGDNDDIPLKWEDKNGLSDSNSQDWTTDLDNDGLNAREEYQARYYDAKQDFPDILIEVDYEEGHAPITGALTYIEDYYRVKKAPSGYHGIHVRFVLDDSLPNDEIYDPGDNIVSTAELLDVRNTWFTASREHAWRYMLVAWYNGGYISPGPVAHPGTPGYTPENQRDTFFIAAGEINMYIVAYNSITGDDLTDEQGQTVVIMHELGHSIDIIEYENDGVTEKYCSTDWCVMAPLGPDNCNARKYCDFHWAMIDLPVHIA